MRAGLGRWVCRLALPAAAPPSHPPTVRSALRMLEGRANKDAQEFVKRLKELEKCMEADP